LCWWCCGCWCARCGSVGKRVEPHLSRNSRFQITLEEAAFLKALLTCAAWQRSLAPRCPITSSSRGVEKLSRLPSLDIPPWCHEGAEPGPELAAGSSGTAAELASVSCDCAAAPAEVSPSMAAWRVAGLGDAPSWLRQEADSGEVAGWESVWSCLGTGGDRLGRGLGSKSSLAPGLLDKTSRK